MHQTLFAIPQAKPSGSTSLTVRTLPKAVVVTGDREVDAVLWLATICEAATDPGDLDRAVEAAARIKTSPEELEKRYSTWLARQPGAHPLFATAGAINAADIVGKAARARERIKAYLEGASVFGSFAAAMELTPAETMVKGAIRPPPGWNGWDALEPGAFAGGVNPTTLAEAVAELRYWKWLDRIRTAMSRTEHPGGHSPDPSDEASARRRYVEGLLLTLTPRDHAEALMLADALLDGLVDIGSVDDGERRAAILDHLLRSLP